MLSYLLTYQSSKLFMRGKLRAKHYVKAGFKCINRHCIDNITKLYSYFSDEITLAMKVVHLSKKNMSYMQHKIIFIFY